jgi:phosphate transport system permease protein
LRRHEKKNLFTSSLVFISGAIIASFGFVKLFSAIGKWLSHGAPFWGPPFVDVTMQYSLFDVMMQDSLIALILILPSLLVFLVGYLLMESHSLGIKLSFALALGLLSLATLRVINFQLGLTAGLLCVSAASMELIRQRRTGSKKDSPVITENIAKFGLRLSGIVTIIILVGLVVYITVRGLKYVSWDFITGSNWSAPAAAQFILGKLNQPLGISHFIIGSLLLVSLCEAIAIPLGLGAAVFLAEYAPKNVLTSTIRFFIEALAGVPSIVIAFVGVGIFVSQYGLYMKASWLAGSLSLAFMILPWNIRVAEEAMKAVPNAFREASYALGATKWQTIRRIVLLAASPGIITGIILGVGAAIGETAVVMWTAGDVNQLPAGLPLTGAGMPSLAVWIYYSWRNIFAGAGVSQWDENTMALSGSFVLLVIFLTISVIALVARNYLSKKYSGR